MREVRPIQFRSAAAVLLLGITCVGAFAQSGKKQLAAHSALPAQELDVSTDPTLTQMPAVGVHDISCDDGGNVYLRSNVPLSVEGSILAQPIVKLAKDGSLSQFATSNIPDLPASPTIFRYAVGPDGHLYEIVRTVADHSATLYLVEFSSDGHYLSKSKFTDSNWVPQAFLPLRSGDFLITTTVVERDKPQRTSAGIYDSDARLKRPIKLSAAEPDTQGALVMTPSRDAQVGRDGNIYLLRRTSPPEVQVVSESGDVLRKLKLAPPIPNSTVGDFFVGDRGLLVEFQTEPSKDAPHPNRLALYDPTDGTLWRSYYLPPRSGFPACLSGSELTILTPSHGYFAISTAEIK